MYAKLFQQVITSSLTQNETIEVRGVFFMMLALADKEGHVLGSDAAIARLINVPVEQFVECVEELQKPDKESQSKAESGRRLVPLEEVPGYFIVNYAKYSGISTDEERRAYFRKKKAEQRARDDAKKKSRNSPTFSERLDEKQAREGAG